MSRFILRKFVLFVVFMIEAQKNDGGGVFLTQRTSPIPPPNISTFPLFSTCRKDKPISFSACVPCKFLKKMGFSYENQQKYLKQTCFPLFHGFLEWYK